MMRILNVMIRKSEDFDDKNEMKVVVVVEVGIDDRKQYYRKR
jgi:hypothetical protein